MPSKESDLLSGSRDREKPLVIHKYTDNHNTTTCSSEPLRPFPRRLTFLYRKLRRHERIRVLVDCHARLRRHVVFRCYIDQAGSTHVSVTSVLRAGCGTKEDQRRVLIESHALMDEKQVTRRSMTRMAICYAEITA